MSNPSFLTESFGRRSLLFVLVSILTLVTIITGAATSQENKVTDKQEAFRRIVRNYIQAGQEEYQRGFFEQAAKTFLMAQEYQQYLTDEERQQLSANIKQAQIADTERKRALRTVQAANELIKQDKLSQAKTSLEGVKASTFLTMNERRQIADVLNQINAQLRDDKNHSDKTTTVQLEAVKKLEEITEQKTEAQNKSNDQDSIAALFYHSIGYYRSGQLEKAREGFIKVAASKSVPEPMMETVRNYLAQIDNSLNQTMKPVTLRQPQQLGTMAVMDEQDDEPAELIEPELEVYNVPETTEQEMMPQLVSPQTRPAAQRVTSPVTGEGSYMDQVRRTQSIIRDYTRTVVNDANEKAHQYGQEGQFGKAKDAVMSADVVVEKNRIHLGEALYGEFKTALKATSEDVAAQEKIQMRQQEQQKRQDASQAQQELREQMEIDRQKRVADLMDNALTYQKQQHYEAALGQLESLLLLDPQNNQALVLKDTIEDTLYFQRQLEIQKEGDKQRADILLRTDESKIPYAEELTYPKNWREIDRKRQPDEPIGLDPEDANVYERLDMLVDLSGITESTSFYQILDILSNTATPPLQIQPNWRDLMDNANIDRTTPAEMEPLTGVKIRKALELLLAGLSTIDYEIGYVVDEGVINIATLDTLPSKMVSRVYDISDLVGEPASYGGLQGLYMGQSIASSMGGMGGGYGGTGGGMGGMGGGMSGGMGGMGGGMMGGMGGGMMGGMGGGYGGGMMGGQMGGIIAQDLVTLVQETIEPDSWFDLSDEGEGTIMPYPQTQPKKLAVMQTHEVHEEIQKLLTAMRKALGNQISIEARYLVVTENFLEEIGLDVDFLYNLGGKWGTVTFDQDSAVAAKGEATQVPLSLGGIGAAANIVGGYGSILDDLQVSFMLQATQAHRDAKSLTAPIVTVLSGESANFNITRYIQLALPPIQNQGVTTVGAGTGTTTGVGGGLTPQYTQVQSGSTLSITPVITHDKKNVLLNIITYQNEFLGIRTTVVEAPVVDGADGADVVTYNVQLPETETSTVMTRVSVPDGGTLLLGGQKISAEMETEAGVPILSKIPILGRLFSNRSTVKDQKVLLILVKPTIMLQEEREAEALAALENEF